VTMTAGAASDAASRDRGIGSKDHSGYCVYKMEVAERQQVQ